MSNHPELHTPIAHFFARRGFAVALACAAVLGLSTCLLGFFIDDYVHLISLEGKVPITSTYDLFCFATGKPGGIESVMGFLPFPWFTDLNAKLHFFRPLSCATMAFDHAVFGRATLPYHLHSALWYLAFIVACWGVLRRSLPSAMAGLAIVLFAVDFGHLFATAWWSNRNALVAAVPAVFGLWAHMRWREDGWRWGLPLSLIGYALGLLGGEVALAVFAYLGAYELFGRSDSLVRRISALIPGATLAVLYLIAYKAGGYGTFGSGIYLDPTENPLQYLRHVPERVVMNIAAQFFLMPVELPAGVDALFWPIVLASTAATGLTVWLAVRTWRDVDDKARNGLRWLTIGGLLSLAPVLATFASARLLLVPSLGGIALLAAILLDLRATARSGALRGLYWVLLGLHLVIAPLAWPAISGAMARIDAVMNASIARSEIDDANAANEVIVVPVAPDPMSAMYTVIAREYNGQPRVKSWNVLSMSQCAHRITRLAANKLEVELVNGEYLETVFDRLLRTPENRFVVGEKLNLPRFDVEILAVGPHGGPSRVTFTFPGDLDQPPYVFLGWKEDRLARISPPAIGQTVEVPFNAGIIDGKYLRTANTSS